MKKSKLILLGILLIGLVILGDVANAIANPASVFCAEQGGEFVIVREEAGERGMCKIGFITVDEWNYYIKCNPDPREEEVKCILPCNKTLAWFVGYYLWIPLLLGIIIYLFFKRKK